MSERYFMPDAMPLRMPTSWITVKRPSFFCRDERDGVSNPSARSRPAHKPSGETDPQEGVQGSVFHVLGDNHHWFAWWERENERKKGK